MGPNTTPNSMLERAMVKIVSTGRETLLRPRVTIRSSADPTFTYAPPMPYLQSMTIHQEAHQDYTDAVYITMDITPAMYLQVWELRTGLLVDITIEYTDRNGVPVQAPAKVTRKYVATIVDPIDVKARLKDAHLYVDTPNLSITLKLFEDTLFTIRRASIHGIYKDTTMHSLLIEGMKQLGITTAKIQPPDNTHLYKTVLVPPTPAQDIATFPSYLQHTYGVYMKGMGYYYTGGCMYIYPAYETDAQTDAEVIIYRGKQGQFAGAYAFHNDLGTVIDIVATGNTSSIDVGDVIADNSGSSRSVLRASQLIDGFTAFTAAGPVLTDQLSAMTIQAPRMAKAGATLETMVRYQEPTDNVCRVASDLAKGHTKVVITQWPQSIPWRLRPGLHAKYLHDDNRLTVTTYGIVESLITQITRSTQGASPTFQSATDIALRITIPE